MSDRNDPLDGALDDLAAAAADGLDVDWASARSRLSAPSHHRLVHELETIAALSRALRQSVAGAEQLPAPVAGPQAPAGPPPAPPEPSVGDSTASFSWGPLRIVREIGRG